MEATLNPGRTRLLAIEGELNTRYLQRKDEVRGMILALLSSNHIELLGPPGTAKSMLTYDFQSYLADADTMFFNWLLTKFTTVEEVMGPVSINSIKEDKYRRITTGKLPEARFAYLDEIYKANSPLLNSLLSILQERVFYNDGKQTVPLQMCVGSSNELPDEDEGLSALRDRFLLRYQVQYIQDAEVFHDLLWLNHNSKAVSQMPVDMLDTAIAEVTIMQLSIEAGGAIELAWSRLRDQGIVVSDRRFKAMIRVMAAESWLAGATEITAESLIVGENILWEQPKQYRDVKQIVRSCVDPNLAEAQEFLNAALEGLSALKAESSTPEEQIGTMRQVQTLLADCKTLAQTSSVAGITSMLQGVNDEILGIIMGGN
ncbi:hypothetical protein LCGC14_1438790 [marine sediment metagenome]|uniref:ATPase n=1 Tax=marine sediment metagenome TaxID=412755 RepID=A0A0F9K7H5_9ZZZZ